jgi:hypothetical protein
MYYIPGARKIDGTPCEYLYEQDSFVLNGTQYPGNWDKASIDGAEVCTFEPCTLDPIDYVVSEDRVGAVIRWVGVPRDPQEAAAIRARRARETTLGEIDRLERSISDRMWREDAVGSTALIVVKKRDEDGNLVDDTDNPRHGKTATQYIAYVNDAIAALSAGL